MSGFEEMGLSPEILRAIVEMGFVNPTPIQQQIIPLLLEDSGDLIGLAQTGTGKTAAFGLPLAELVDPRQRKIQALILCPTRELCVQIAGDLEKYTAHMPAIRTLAVYGGANIMAQIQSLRKGVHFVAGTPGRVLDLIKRRELDFSAIRWLILDEADEMLNMGFKEELDEILASTPGDKQTLLFSATMPQEMQAITRKYMHEPREISAGKKNTGATNVNHVYYMVHAKDRYEALKRIADLHPSIYGLVFCRTRAEAKDVADKLMRDGYNADALHGDLSQAQRDHVMARFRTGQIQLLVATDVAARGLDVNDLTHVIQYNLPDDADVYLHRSGRTGRAGKFGTSISIIHTREVSRIKLLEKKVAKPFERKMVPGGREICEKQLFHLIDKMEKVAVEEGEIESYMPVIYKKLEWLSKEDVIKRFVALEFNRFLAYYQGAQDLNPKAQSGSGSRDRDFSHENKWESRREGGRDGSRDGGREGSRESRGEGSRDRTREVNRSGGSEEGFSRFFISLGRVHNLNPQWLIGLVNEHTRTRNIPIGRIEIGQKFSFFEADSRFEKEILQGFRQSNGLQVKIALPEESGPSPKPFRKKRNA